MGIMALGDGDLFALQARAALQWRTVAGPAREIVIMLAQYVGYPRASRLRNAVAPVLKDGG
jgi:hypothetical protein